jgi:hypothetical protein
MCGRSVEQEIAELSKVITTMQFRNRDMVEARTLLMRRLQGAIATRSLLQQAADQQRTTGGGPIRRMTSRTAPRPRGGAPFTAATPPGRIPVDEPATAGARAAGQGGTGGRRVGGTAGRGTGTGPPGPRIGEPRLGSLIKMRATGPGGATPMPAGPHPPEASTGSMQNVLLWLGALLFAITGTGYLMRTLGGGGRVAIFALLAIVALTVPIYFARRGLTSTAETIASVGLLFVLLDGYAGWSAQWFSGTGLSRTGYAGLVCLVTAGVAGAYRYLSHLKAPRFAAVLLLQMVLPLLAAPIIHDATGWAGVLAAIAAEDLALAMMLRARPNGTPYLQDAVWVLHGLAVLAAVIGSVIALAQAHTVHNALAGAAALLLVAAVGLHGGLALGRWPLPDIGAGLATLAVIGAVGRLGAVAAPGRGLVITAMTVLFSAVAIRFIRPVARGGPQLAGALAAGGLGLIILGRGFDGILGPLRAALPAWHADLGQYRATVDAAAGPDSWQLALAALILTVAAIIMLPGWVRPDGAIGGLTLTLLLVPAAFRLPWAAAPLVLVLGAVAIGGYALTATSSRSVWVRVGAAAALGFDAAGVSLAEPGAGAVTLTTIAVAGAMIGVAPRLTPGLSGPPAQLAGEAALGGAAFALPGAVAFGTAALAPGTGPVPVLAAAFLAVAGTLSAAAVAQVARHMASPLLAGGAALGAITVAIATFRTHVTLVDAGVSALLLVGALLLFLAPPLADRRAGSRLDGADLAAAVVTAAAIAALARVASLVAPRYGLATAAGLVLLVALGVRAMPADWRRGPTVGSTLVGTVVGLIAGTVAFQGGLSALGAVRPIWHTNLATWQAAGFGHYGGQIPLALLLVAVAAATVLPRPMADVLSVIAVGLAALSVPAALGLPWWSPILFSGATAAACGIAAGAARTAPAGYARAGVATLLFADTVGASLVRPDVTAVTLVSSALVHASVAVTATLTRRRHPDADHLVMIGGGSLAGALLTLTAAAGCLARAGHEPLSVALTAALAGLGLGLAIVTVTCYNSETLLPYATGGVAVGGTAIAIGTFETSLPVEVYAAAVALLTVVAELFRAAVIARRVTLSGAGLRPRRLPPRQGYALLLAAGPATILAAITLAPSVAAALIGPYRWLGSIWSGPPRDSVAALGSLASWVGDGNEVVAAVILTLAAALGSVGFGGSPTTVQIRAVAAVIPGVAITLLIAPATLHRPWPDGPLAAVVVAVLAGLGVALTPTPPNTLAAEPLRAARRLVVVICLLASGAGLAGSLATKGVTLTALTAMTAAGLVAAVAGRTRTARITGWLATAFAGHLLALVAGSVAGLPSYWSAFLVGSVAGALLLLAALLPQLRRPDAASETITVEASAYAGAVLAMLLAARSLPHLAVLAFAWGAVLGVAAAKPGRAVAYRRALIWLGWAHELVAWWLLMHISNVALPEAYTLAVAAIALITGYLEARRHPELSSWLSYGVALAAALLPSLAIVLATGQTPLRRALLIVAAAATVAIGARSRQQAPVVVGGVVLTAASLHELAVLSTTALLWTVMALVGGLLVGLGANFEKRRRDLQRLRGALGRLR